MARPSARPRKAPLAIPRRVAMVIFPELQVLDAVGPLEVFARANQVWRERNARGPDAYELLLVARSAGAVPTSTGFSLLAPLSLTEVRGPLDTLVVAGGNGVFAAGRDRALLRWLARQAPRARRVASVCTGAFLLAELGLLDGLRVTTHWSACEVLQQRYPKLRVDPDPIYVREGRIWTSAGVTAGMDLALALVEDDLGRDVALAVARRLVLFLKRPGGQSQFSVQLAGQLAGREPLRELQSWIAEHPGSDLTVEALAKRVGMSPRNFARVFTQQVGRTPARFVEESRVEAARRRLEESDDPVDAIAARTGFGSAETMRRAFLRVLRVNPASYRSRFRSVA